MTQVRVPPGPGQESVWDYPRPPRLEAEPRPVAVVLGGETIAQSTEALRILETSHPPVYYLPAGDVGMGVVSDNGARSWCEWKGEGCYLDVKVGTRREEAAAWRYDRPDRRYAPLAGFVAFYAHRMDGCYVGDELVVAQPGDFYGGWITSLVVGPFKGGPGSWGW
ncbi:MAG: DUF427 domain-containing protein [Actinomycetota bacterium]|nr:DUF427 domain-containing protein [Actinomycetota bacterium]